MKRYVILLPICDLAAVYDNTDSIRRIAIYKGGMCVKISKNIPHWFKDVI